MAAAPVRRVKQYRHASPGDDGEVEEAIAVEFSHRHRPGTEVGGVADRILEATVALAQQNTYRGRVHIGNDKVRNPVAVNVSHRHRGRTVAGSERDGSLEGAVPF